MPEYKENKISCSHNPFFCDVLHWIFLYLHSQKIINRLCLFKHTASWRHLRMDEICLSVLHENNRLLCLHWIVYHIKWKEKCNIIYFHCLFFESNYSKPCVLTCLLWWWSFLSQCHGTSSRGQHTVAPPVFPPWMTWQQAQGLQHWKPDQYECQRSRKFAQWALLSLNRCSAQNLQNKTLNSR